MTVVGRGSCDLSDATIADPDAMKMLEAITNVSHTIPPAPAVQAASVDPGAKMLEAITNVSHSIPPPAVTAAPIVTKSLGPRILSTASQPPMPSPVAPSPLPSPRPVALTPAPVPAVSAVGPYPTMMTEVPPPVRGRYEMMHTLGEGAFGRVVAARDNKLGRVVALKLLHDEHAKNEEVHQRFLQEARAAGCIDHPGVVTVFDVGDLEGTNTPYIVMEMLTGESLQARLERTGPLPSARVKAIGVQIASALAAAHRVGVIHRDLKPENVFIVADRAAIGGERMKILDFGLAKPQLIAASVTTRAGAVFGTPAYMSPEQFASARDVDRRSDIYSLGCILFHLATGRPPFEGNFIELVKAHRMSPPPSIRAAVPDASAALDALVQRMLAKEPAGRPASMSDVEDALDAPEVVEPVPAPAATPPAPAPQPKSRWSLRGLFTAKPKES